VQRLDVGHHPLVGEGLFPVVFRDLDVALTLHQVDHVHRGHPKPLDGVRGRHRVRREELPQPGGLFGGHPTYEIAQVVPHPFDLRQDESIKVAECRRGK
jgi:hypothetical protein